MFFKKECKRNKSKKYTALIIFFALLFLVNYIHFLPDKITMEIKYIDENDDNNSAQIFWTQNEENYSEDRSSSGKIINGIACLQLEGSGCYADRYRLDFSNTTENYEIESISLYVNNKLNTSIKGADLKGYIQNTINITSYIVIGDALYIEPYTNDSCVYLNANFTSLLHQLYKERNQLVNYYGKTNIVMSLLVIIIFVIFLMRKKIIPGLKVVIDQIIYDFKTDHIRVFCYFSIIFIGITLVIYWRYLIGDDFYIFTNGDIASDSINQTYPSLMSVARKIEEGDYKALWNNTISLGNIQKPIYPTLNNWVSWFGTSNVAYLLGISQFFKVLLSGFLFYSYLRTMNISRSTSSIFSLSYAYCSHIIVRGGWEAYPNEVVLFALWLYCFEQFYVKKNYKWLPIVTAIFFLNFDGYRMVLYMMIFFAYAIFRYYSEHSAIEMTRQRLKEHMLFIFSMMISLSATSIVMFPSLSTMLDTNLFSANKQSFFNRFSFSNIFEKEDMLKVLYFRTIGNDIIGINRYLGNRSILDDPTFYCGILVLLLVPVGICIANRRQKCWYMAGLVMAICYIIIIPIRYISNGFRDYTYKLSSLWIIVLLIFIAAQGLEKLKVQNSRISHVFLLVIICIYLALVKIFYIEGLNKKYLIVSITFIVVYCILLFILNRKTDYMSIKLLLLIFCAVEISWMSYRVVNDRNVLGSKSNEVFDSYDDNTYEAVNFLSSIDDAFYRIDKSYLSVFLCDSLYQGYQGTKGYIGGTGDRNLTSQFYVNLGFPIYSHNHYTWGFESSTSINTLLNVKYYLTKKTLCSNYGYEIIDDTENIFVYKNMNALSLGSHYDRYILRDDFDKLTIAQKRNTIMKACVLEEEPDEKTAKNVKIKRLSNSEIGDTLNAVENPDMYLASYSLNYENADYTVSFRKLNENEIAIVRLKLTNNDSIRKIGSMVSTGSRIYYGNETEKYSYYSDFASETNEYIYEFNIAGTDRITFEITDLMNIDKFELYIFPKSVYYKEYLDQVGKLNLSKLDLTEWTDSNYNGIYSALEPGITFFAIPYDENWHLYVDGEEVALFQANIGFMGAYISAGDHQMTLKYEKNDAVYYILSITGCVMYAVYLIICSKIHRSKYEKYIDHSARLQ